MRLLVSEWLKTKRTPIRWLVFFLPLCISGCAAYFAYRRDVPDDSIYNIFFTVWTAMLMPIIISLLTGAYVREEESAGNFSGFLNTNIPRRSLYLGKFAISALSLTVCTIFTTLVLCTGLNLTAPGRISTTFFLACALLVCLGALPALALHLWISFAFGLGASVSVGILGLLAAVLMGTTNLGNTLWVAAPWSYPVKLAFIPYAFSTAGPDIREQLLSPFLTCALLSAALTLLFLASGILWFRRWEGRPCAE